MITQLSHQRPPHWMATRQAGARLGRLAAVVAAVISGLLASVAVVPAAFARVVPPPGEAYEGHVAPASVPAQIQYRTIVAGGMPGWQIALIAVGAALVAAALAVLADRKLTSRSGATATTA
jgi:hypothetical protein